MRNQSVTEPETSMLHILRDYHIFHRFWLSSIYRPTLVKLTIIIDGYNFIIHWAKTSRENYDLSWLGQHIAIELESIYANNKKTICLSGWPNSALNMCLMKTFKNQMKSYTYMQDKYLIIPKWIIKRIVAATPENYWNYKTIWKDEPIYDSFKEIGNYHGSLRFELQMSEWGDSN